MTNDNLCRAGGCTCGEVRYEVRSDPLIVHACHCTLCQRQTGGPHVLNALFEAERIVVTKGTVTTTVVPTPSGAGQKIARCPTCFVAVWSNYLIYRGGLGELVRFLRVSTLDDPTSMSPDVHICTSSKAPWYVIPPEQYAVEEFYVPEETLSKNAQDRLRVLERGQS